MLRAVSQMVTSNAAATAMTTAATSIQNRQAAQSSASVIGILPGDALIEVVASVPRAVSAPEALLLAGWPARLLRSHVLPHVVEELHRPVGHGLCLDVRPSAWHVLQDVPPMLAVGLAIREPPQSADDTAHALGGERRDDRARWR